MEVLDIYVERSGVDQYGQLNDGWIDIKAPILQVQVRGNGLRYEAHFKSNGREYRIHDLHTYGSFILMDLGPSGLDEHMVLAGDRTTVDVFLVFFQADPLKEIHNIYALQKVKKVDPRVPSKVYGLIVAGSKQRPDCFERKGVSGHALLRRWEYPIGTMKLTMLWETLSRYVPKLSASSRSLVNTGRLFGPQAHNTG